RVASRTLFLSLCFVFLAASASQAQSTIVELNEAGWKAVREGDGDRAAALFTQALSQRPDDPVLLVGAGTAAQLQGRSDDAIARLQRALELRPNLTLASQLLGQIAWRQGQADLAIRTYEQALTFAPLDALLAEQLAAWRREADVHRGFEEVRDDRFRVMF